MAKKNQGPEDPTASTVNEILAKATFDIAEMKFLKQAIKKFNANEDCFKFDEWAFGKCSPIWNGAYTPLDVTIKPLYKVLDVLSDALFTQQEYMVID